MWDLFKAPRPVSAAATEMIAEEEAVPAKMRCGLAWAWKLSDSWGKHLDACIPFRTDGFREIFPGTNFVAFGGNGLPPVWKLNFDGVHKITRVEILNRGDRCCLARLANNKLVIGDEKYLPQVVGTLTGARGWQTVSTDIVGTYIKVVGLPGGIMQWAGIRLYGEGGRRIPISGWADKTFKVPAAQRDKVYPRDAWMAEETPVPAGMRAGLAWASPLQAEWGKEHDAARPISKGRGGGEYDGTAPGDCFQAGAGIGTPVWKLNFWKQIKVTRVEILNRVDADSDRLKGSKVILGD